MLSGADQFCQILFERINSTMKLQSVRRARKRDLTRDIAESVHSQMWPMLIQIWKAFSNLII